MGGRVGVRAGAASKRALPRVSTGIALPLLLAAGPSPRLVPDVSQHRIEIVTSFTGAELLLFGAILYPGGRTPAKPPAIVVVVKGPAEPVLLREKRKIAGIWVNAASARFRSVPAFYAVAASRPLAGIVGTRARAIYELGLDSIQLSPASGADPIAQKRFEEGLVGLKQRGGLYAESGNGVAISEGVLYRARVAIPARVPVGTYTAETFLVQDGRVAAAAVRDIAIDKAGFEGFVAAAAARWSIAYGLVAIALSLGLGWAAGVLFRRI